MISVKLPIHTTTESNTGGHFWGKAKRAREQRLAASLAVAARVVSPAAIGGSLVVTMTRIGPRQLDSDNLASALKHVRDGVADALDIDDGDPRIEWRVDQRKTIPGEFAMGGKYGVAIAVQGKP